MSENVIFGLGMAGYILIGLATQYAYVRWGPYMAEADDPLFLIVVGWPLGALFFAGWAVAKAFTYPERLAVKARTRAAEKKREAEREAGQLSMPEATGGEVSLR